MVNINSAHRHGALCALLEHPVTMNRQIIIFSVGSLRDDWSGRGRQCEFAQARRTVQSHDDGRRTSRGLLDWTTGD